MAALQEGAFYATIGRRLREGRLRLKVPLSQQAVARAVGLSRPSVVNIEKGRQPIDLQVFVKWAEKIGMTVDELLQPVSLAAPKRIDPGAEKWMNAVNSTEEEDGTAIRASPKKG